MTRPGFCLAAPQADDVSVASCRIMQSPPEHSLDLRMIYRLDRTTYLLESRDANDGKTWDVQVCLKLLGG
ncbi:MAG: hypothetical protein M1839_003216 [Geoglossum umbratile]|nr:MAG: hypothetical protein M1839_003216 [Geoglossum umbratile]